MHTGFRYGDLRERDHLEKPRYMWEDGIQTDIREIALEGTDFIPGKFRVQIWT